MAEAKSGFQANLKKDVRLLLYQVARVIILHFVQIMLTADYLIAWKRSSKICVVILATAASDSNPFPICRNPVAW